MKLPQFWRRWLAAKFAKLVGKIWQRHRCLQDLRLVHFVSSAHSLLCCWCSLCLKGVSIPHRTLSCRKLIWLVEQPAWMHVQRPLFYSCSLLQLSVVYKSQFMSLVHLFSLVMKLSLWLTLTTCFESLTNHRSKSFYRENSALKALPYLLVSVFPTLLWVLAVCHRSFAASFR